MKFHWTVKKKVETPAEIKLEQIKELLFPQLELNEELSQEGQLVKFHVDYSVDSNLEAVLMDLQEGYNDESVQKTVNTVIKRLIEVRKLLEAYAKFNPESKYIIVDNPKVKDDIENIT